MSSEEEQQPSPKKQKVEKEEITKEEEEEFSLKKDIATLHRLQEEQDWSALITLAKELHEKIFDYAFKEKFSSSFDYERKKANFFSQFSIEYEDCVLDFENRYNRLGTFKINSCLPLLVKEYNSL